MLAERSPEVKKAVVRLMELSNDERTRMLYDSRMKMEWDIQRRERLALQEQAYSFARKMLKRKRPIDEIMEDTGLTHTEIKELRDAD